jgi:hypothetical protein
MLCAVLHFVADNEGPHAIAESIISRLAPGSMVAISHACSTGADPEVIAGISAAYGRYGLRMIWRDEAAIKDLFTSRVTLLPPPGTAAGGLGDPRLWLRRRFIKTHRCRCEPASGSSPVGPEEPRDEGMADTDRALFARSGRAAAGSLTCTLMARPGEPPPVRHQASSAGTLQRSEQRWWWCGAGEHAVQQGVRRLGGHERWQRERRARLAGAGHRDVAVPGLQEPACAVPRAQA